jgi:hypothetical protein
VTSRVSAAGGKRSGGDLGEEQFIAHNVKTPSRNRIFELFAEHQTPLNISIELRLSRRSRTSFAGMPSRSSAAPSVLRLRAGNLTEVAVEGMKIEVRGSSSGEADALTRRKAFLDCQAGPGYTL